MTFHAPRKIKPSVGLLADEFPEPWLRISQVEAEQGDLRGRHRPPLRAIPGFSLPTSRLDRRVELPTFQNMGWRPLQGCDRDRIDPQGGSMSAIRSLRRP